MFLLNESKVKKMSVQTEDRNKKVLVATYGSLRRRMGNFGVNGRAGGEYSFTGLTKECYNLYEYGGGGFPSVSLKHNSSGTQVVVDVFETTVEGLKGPYDSLEGYPYFYNRTELQIIKPDGTEVTAWMYHIDNEQRVPVPHGDWCVHKHGANYYADNGFETPMGFVETCEEEDDADDGVIYDSPEVDGGSDAYQEIVGNRPAAGISARMPSFATLSRAAVRQEVESDFEPFEEATSANEIVANSEARRDDSMDSMSYSSYDSSSSSSDSSW